MSSGGTRTLCCSDLQRSEWHSGRYALYLPGLEALGAHADAQVLAVNAGTNCLQVRTEAALIADM